MSFVARQPNRLDRKTRVLRRRRGVSIALLGVAGLCEGTLPNEASANEASANEVFTNVAFANVALGVVAEARSDWVYHGASETDNQPSLGINAEYDIGSVWFAGLELHDSNATSERQRHRGVMGYLGVALPVGERWHMTASVKRRTFPGSAKEWDYTEYDWRLSHASGLSVRLDYAPDYYAHDTESFGAEIGVAKGSRRALVLARQCRLPEPQRCDRPFARRGVVGRRLRPYQHRGGLRLAQSAGRCPVRGDVGSAGDQRPHRLPMVVNAHRAMVPVPS